MNACVMAVMGRSICTPNSCATRTRSSKFGMPNGLKQTNMTSVPRLTRGSVSKVLSVKIRLEGAFTPFLVFLMARSARTMFPYRSPAAIVRVRYPTMFDSKPHL